MEWRVEETTAGQSDVGLAVPVPLGSGRLTPARDTAQLAWHWKDPARVNAATLLWPGRSDLLEIDLAKMLEDHRIVINERDRSLDLGQGLL